jgi:capsule polysaccharide export protein KpsC/LpsZ
MGLLQSVRKANPSAHVIYKPRRCGGRLRKKGEDEDEAGSCNEVVIDIAMGELHSVDECIC